MMKIVNRLRQAGAVAAVALACAAVLLPASAFASDLTSTTLNTGTLGTSSLVSAESGISATRYGVDVSYHNGVINWGQASKSIDFAIIRCGYGDYKDIGKNYTDEQWENNKNGCKNNGVKFGVYFYSYCDSLNDARLEGEYCGKLVKDCGNTFPVYYDLEDPCISDLSALELTWRYTAFIQGLQLAGYKGAIGIYSSASWWENKLDGCNVRAADRWVAHWYSKAPGDGFSDTYAKGCALWQYTNKASIGGIPSDRVDGNFADTTWMSGNYQDLFRLYNKYSGEHLYTMDASEVSKIDGVGWISEGKAARIDSGNSVEVYRLYNPYSGDHHYTTDASERDYLATIGWKAEGTSFKTKNSGTAMYRLFNPYEKVGTHLYTTNKDEYDYLATIGWRQEGVAMYF